MKTIALSPIRFLIIALVCFSLSSCDVDYWWSRGKPPTSEKLLNLSQSKFDAIVSSTSRNEVKADFIKLQKLLADTHSGLKQGVAGDKLKSNLVALTEAMYSLEGRISWGSRAPYGELLGQLRGFENIAQINGTVDTNVFTLYTARVYFFLSDELAVPAPVGPLATY